METQELINKFCEKTNIESNSKIASIIAYGSRITGYEYSSSDLDLFIVAYSKKSYRYCTVIDGIDVEATVISFDELEDKLVNASMANNHYYRSVINTGTVIYDKLDIISLMNEILDKKVKMRKINFPSELITELTILINNFKYSEDKYVDFYYFNILETIRNIYYQLNNISFLNYRKIYDMYQNQDYARDIYKLDLPSQDFIELFLEAINKTSKEERISIINKLCDLINYSNLEKNYSYREKGAFIDTDDIKIRLSHLNRKVCRLEEMLISNHPFKEYVYFCLLKELKDFYLLVYHFDDSDLDELYKIAINSVSLDDRIKALENLFNFVDKDYRFDYHNYCLRY
ncbi:MAG: hypothetical protein J1F35_02565 [Erysipelotrichales bacterium]|nr:hypothetical protein [Erysipelotrichales bacterium]